MEDSYKIQMSPEETLRIWREFTYGVAPHPTITEPWMNWGYVVNNPAVPPVAVQYVEFSEIGDPTSFDVKKGG